MSGNVRQARLRWTGQGMAFRGGPDGGAEIGVDGGGVEGPAPMHLLLMSVGACMAIEDGVVLTRALNGCADKDIPAALARYEDERKPRTKRIQVASLANEWLKNSSNAEWVYGYDAWNTPLN